MNKGLNACAVALSFGGMNVKNYFENGTIKKFKHVITSKKGELLTFDVIYENEPGYAEAKMVIP